VIEVIEDEISDRGIKVATDDSAQLGLGKIIRRHFKFLLSAWRLIVPLGIYVPRLVFRGLALPASPSSLRRASLSFFYGLREKKYTAVSDSLMAAVCTLCDVPMRATRACTQQYRQHAGRSIPWAKCCAIASQNAARVDHARSQFLFQ